MPGDDDMQGNAQHPEENNCGTTPHGGYQHGKEGHASIATEQKEIDHPDEACGHRDASDDPF
jgi:hypothetical protein